MKRLIRPLTACATLTLASLGLYTGCSVDSADSFYRDVSVNFSGYYTNPNGGSIVAQNSGSSIESLDLRQTGDSLQAVDNNSIVWKGTLGEVENGASTFELNGTTTRGIEATLSGTLTSSDGGTAASGTTANVTGTMKGTYIEPNRYSTVYATASIPGSDTEDDSGTETNASTNVVSAISTTPELTTLSRTTNGTVTLSVANASTYTYTVSSSIGSISGKSGNTLTYRQSGTSTGTNVVTVSSGGKTDSATIIQD